MKDVNKLLNKKWVSFNEALKDVPKKSGVYLISDKKSQDGKTIDIKDIKYVGQSTSMKGVNGRLHQFKRGLNAGKGHSGANRLSGKIEIEKLVAAYITFDAITDKTKRTGEDLRVMGKVKSLEYQVMAYLKEQNGVEPEWNKQ